MALDHIFKDTDYIQLHGWAKVIKHLKEQFDQWAIDRLAKKGYTDFKMTYMPVIMNIDMTGTNNNELANRANVTKQAMSKVINELKKSGYISSKTDPTDKRSTIFSLTSKGKSFVMSARASVAQLMNEYRKEMGKKNYDDLLQKLVSIIEYNDKKMNG